MPDNEGVLIYPEGTRYSEAKRIKFTGRVSEQGGTIGDIAAGYQRVLPPRTAGTLEILSARPLDVVVLAHHGFDGFAEVRDIWSGGLVGSTIAMRFHRIPNEAIPADDVRPKDLAVRDVDGRRPVGRRTGGRRRLAAVVQPARALPSGAV